MKAVPFRDADYRMFVHHLVALRKRLNIKQEDVAFLLGKPQSYVSKTERFERRIDPCEFACFVLAMGRDPVTEFAAVVSRMRTEMPR